MTLRRVTLCTALAVAVASCTGGDDPEGAPTTTVAPSATSTTTTTAPERPASTTTTAFDPASVEGAVEAAYLRSWDVYADAVYDLELDEPALAEVYAEEHLDQARRDRGGSRTAGQRSSSSTTTTTSVHGRRRRPCVIDRYRNHQVLIDPETKEPIEDDPDEALV